MPARLRAAARVVACLGIAGALAAVSGCGAGSSAKQGESADAFVKRITVEFSLGQAGRLWGELLPAQQAVVPRARFVQCQTNQGWVLKRLKVLDTYEEPVEASGKEEPATAVSLQVTSDTGETNATIHAISVKGTWHWILKASELAAYKRGKCP
ncbi:MAG: hypothetical protein ACXVY8_02900 [Gaiellaceae bacterium]